MVQTQNGVRTVLRRNLYDALNKATMLFDVITSTQLTSQPPHNHTTPLTMWSVLQRHTMTSFPVHLQLQWLFVASFEV